MKKTKRELLLEIRILELEKEVLELKLQNKPLQINLPYPIHPIPMAPFYPRWAEPPTPVVQPFTVTCDNVMTSIGKVQ